MDKLGLRTYNYNQREGDKGSSPEYRFRAEAQKGVQNERKSSRDYAGKRHRGPFRRGQQSVRAESGRVQNPHPGGRRVLQGVQGIHRQEGQEPPPHQGRQGTRFRHPHHPVPRVQGPGHEGCIWQGRRLLREAHLSPHEERLPPVPHLRGLQGWRQAQTHPPQERLHRGQPEFPGGHEGLHREAHRREGHQDPGRGQGPVTYNHLPTPGTLFGGFPLFRGNSKYNM